RHGFPAAGGRDRGCWACLSYYRWRGILRNDAATPAIPRCIRRQLLPGKHGRSGVGRLCRGTKVLCSQGFRKAFLARRLQRTARIQECQSVSEVASPIPVHSTPGGQIKAAPMHRAAGSEPASPFEELLEAVAAFDQGAVEHGDLAVANDAVPVAGKNDPALPSKSEAPVLAKSDEPDPSKSVAPPLAQPSVANAS